MTFSIAVMALRIDPSVTNAIAAGGKELKSAMVVSCLLIVPLTAQSTSPAATYEPARWAGELMNPTVTT